MSKTILICPYCGGKNSIDRDKAGAKLRCGHCKNVFKAINEPININSLSYEKEVLNMPGYVLLVFYSDTCPHCRNLMPALDSIARERAGILRVAKVNTAHDIELASKYQIRGVPNLFLYKDGKQVAKLPGAVPKPELDNFLNSNKVL
jgi:thioredoxin 2